MRFGVCPDHGDEGLGQDAEGDVAVPAEAGAAFEVVQAEAGLELAVVVLDQGHLILARRASSSMAVSSGRVDSQ